MSDLVGSTRVLAREGSGAADDLRHAHEALVRSVVGVFGGTTVKSTGDGMIVVFHGADVAIRCAAALQEAHHLRDLRPRLGLSTGDAVHEDGDWFGQPVIEAARLCNLAEPGETLVAGVSALVRGVRHEPALVRRARRHLRGFASPIDVYVVAPPAPRPPPTPSRPVPDDAEDLVGRDDVLAVVRGAWERASERAVAVLLCGEPGIGKTRVAEAMASATRADGGAVVWCGFQADRTDAFERLCAALDEASSGAPDGRLAALGPSDIERLAGVLPSVAARFPVEPVQPADGADRAATFDALVRMLERLSAPRTLVVLDDMQWGGGTVEAFLDCLLDRARATLMVLLTTRDTDPSRGALARRDVTRLQLHGLDRPSVAALLADHLGNVADEVTEQVVARTDGNPFLVLTLAHQGEVAGGEDPVAARFLALPDDQVEVLSSAAVLGRELDLGALEALLDGHAPDDLLRLLEVSVRAGLLAERTNLPGRFIFAHELLREAALARLGAARRARLHARAVAALRDRLPDPIDVLDHVLEGFLVLEPADAVELAAAGIRSLTESAAYEEALAAARRLTARVEADPRCSDAERALAYLALARAHDTGSDLAATKVAANIAASAALAAGRTDVLVEAALTRASYGVVGGPDPEADELLTTAVAAVAPDDLISRSRLLGMQAFYQFNFVGRGPAAHELSRQALELARRSSDVAGLAEALSIKSFVLLSSGELDEQLATLGELDSLRRRLPPARATDMRASVARQGGVAALQLGDRARFELHHDTLRELVERRRSWLLGGLEQLWTALLSLTDGDLDTAEQAAAGVFAHPYRDDNFVASAAAALVEVHRWRGTLATIAPLVEQLATAAPAFMAAQVVNGLAAALVGDTARAAGIFDEITASGEPVLQEDTTLSGQLAHLVELGVLVGRPIPTVLEERLHAFDNQVLVLSWGVYVIGATDRFLAIAAAVDGRREEAARRFDAARDLELRLGPVPALRTSLWREVLLGDVEVDEVPAVLADGARVEREVLRGATATLA